MRTSQHREGCLAWLGLTLGLLACVFASARAQEHPTLSKRLELVAALNQAVAAREPTVTISNVEVRNAVTEVCDAVAALTFELEYDGDVLRLKRLLRAAHVISGEMRHPIADDLNDWLNTVWALQLNGIAEFDALPWYCPTSGQRYFNASTTTGDLVDIIRDITGETYMLSKYYDIDGQTVRGSDLLFFDPVGTRSVDFIVDTGAPDTTQRKRLLASGFVKVECGNPDQGMSIDFVVKPETSPDSLEFCMGQQDGPLIEITLRNLGSSWSCRFVLNGGTEGQRNANMWQTYTGKRGSWVPGIDDTDPVPELGGFSVTGDGRLLFRLYHSDQCAPYVDTLCKVVRTDADAEYCEVDLCMANGEPGVFELDARGRLVYRPPEGGSCGDDCQTQDIPCLAFCDDVPDSVVTEHGVISATAVTFDEKMPVLSVDAFPSTWGMDLHNAFQRGERGKWRPAGQFAYRTVVMPGSSLFPDNLGAQYERIYADAGVFDLRLYRWNASNDSTVWLRTSSVRRYSQNGEPVDESDVLWLPSAARFGYGQQLPVMIGRNATSESMEYRSFEDGSDANLPGDGFLTDETAHSGRWCYEVPDDDWSEPIVSAYVLDPFAAAQGLLVRAWVRNTYDPTAPDRWNNTCPVRLRLQSIDDPVQYELEPNDFAFVAKTGEWSLFESAQSSIAGGSYRIQVRTTASERVWIDDLRIQPLLSEAVCYAYDPVSLRLAATFDDQHFGVYYQYNGEGKLIRKIRETERGVRTMQETQYHSPETQRSGTLTSMARTRPTSRGFTVAGPTDWRGSHAASSPPADTIKTNVDMLDAELSSEGGALRIFGLQPSELADAYERIENLIVGSSIDSCGLSPHRRVRLLAELEELDRRLDTAHSSARLAADSSARAAAENLTTRLERRRAAIGKQLNLDAEGIEALVPELHALRRELQSTSGNTEETQ